MAVYFITGKLGGGKTLATVKKAQEYLKQGRKVATNLDLKLEYLLPSRNKQTVIRIPDKPRLQDLELIGLGHDGDSYNQNKNGLLILDELGTWFNSRTWNDKGRQEIIDYMLHIRKKRWDVMLIVQDVSIVDKQLRDTLCQLMAVCKDMGAMGVPLVNFVTRSLFDYQVSMPSFHVASIYDGSTETGIRMDRWVYKAKELYPAYDTEQIFQHDEKVIDGELVDMRASYCMLSAWHLKGRYQPTLWKRIAKYLEVKILTSIKFIAAVAFWVLGRSPSTQHKTVDKNSGLSLAVPKNGGQPLSRLVRVICDENPPLPKQPDMYLFPDKRVFIGGKTALRASNT